MRVTREGAPETRAHARIIKYDGNEKEPRWMDVQRGSTLDFMLIPVFGTHDLEDKFETLCRVYGDISAAPSTPQPGSNGKMCYYREFDVVLLVGLTELKTQIRWIDSVTVRVHEQFL